MHSSQVAISILIGYGFGCVQTAYILGRLVGKMDIRGQGSGNAGASNVTMVLGWKYGILTATLDVMKGILPVVLVKTLYPNESTMAFLSGMAAIAGHIFPFYLRFRGGKGVATLLGALIGIDVRLGLIFMVVMIVLPLYFDYIVVGSLTVFTALPVACLVLRLPAICLVVSALLTIIAYVKHMENVKRIMAGTEVRISATLKRSST
ncbi:MAG: glycerol-3-phosphate 1-O-acyltransferase PlsY [Anaerolineae bacterium]|nr:glycerol-3-phosphate 1-O-acyltransferase PlsY [Anaerolineae bacterium]